MAPQMYIMVKEILYKFLGYSWFY